MRILVTGVRAPAAVDWAVALRNAGHEVILADCVPAHAARSALGELPFVRFPAPALQPGLFHEALTGIVSAHSIDMVLPSCEEVFHIAALRAALKPAAVFCPGVDLLARLHSKLEFLELAQAAGANPPPAVRLVGIDRPTGPMKDCVIKREFSRFGGSTIIGPSQGQLARLRNHGENPWIVQERVRGREFCTFSVAFEGRLTAHTTYLPRHRLGGSASFYFEPAEHAGIESFVTRFIASTGFHGQIGFDIFERPDGTLAPVDCNPRATSGIHFFRGDPGLGEALTGTTGEVIRPREPRAAMLPVAMAIFGSPAAMLRGKAGGFWRDFSAAASVPVARPSLLSELADLGFYFGRTVTRGVSLVGATTVDIEWNGGRR